MDLLTFLMQSPDLSEKTITARFASQWAPQQVAKGVQISRQDMPDTDEYIVLQGCLASRIYAADGTEVCVGLHVGASVVTPNIARTRGGLAYVAIDAVSDAMIARLDTERLTQLMIDSEPVRDWGNGVLRDTLGQKAGREWCLAALGGADRLTWFRSTHPGYEDIFPHSMIASYLGMTPVTLSRLRSKDPTKK